MIPLLWADFRRRAHEIVDKKNTRNIGLCDVPKDNKNHPDEYFYVAGTEVREGSCVFRLRRPVVSVRLRPAFRSVATTG